MTIKQSVPDLVLLLSRPVIVVSLGISSFCIIAAVVIVVSSDIDGLFKLPLYLGLLLAWFSVPGFVACWIADKYTRSSSSSLSKAVAAKSALASIKLGCVLLANADTIVTYIETAKLTS